MTFPGGLWGSWEPGTLRGVQSAGFQRASFWFLGDWIVLSEETGGLPCGPGMVLSGFLGDLGAPSTHVCCSGTGAALPEQAWGDVGAILGPPGGPVGVPWVSRWGHSGLCVCSLTALGLLWGVMGGSEGGPGNLLGAPWRARGVHRPKQDLSF